MWVILHMLIFFFYTNGINRIENIGNKEYKEKSENKENSIFIIYRYFIFLYTVIYYYVYEYVICMYIFFPRRLANATPHKSQSPALVQCVTSQCVILAIASRKVSAMCHKGSFSHAKSFPPLVSFFLSLSNK